MGQKSVRKTNEEFVREAKEIHGDFYDYSEVEYTTNKTKVIILCPIHGKFSQSPNKHLSGQGCPECAKDKRKGTLQKNYGVDNPMKSPEIRERVKKTSRRKYGTDHPIQSESVQDRILKTWQENYGTDNPMKNADVARRSTETWVARYGKGSGEGYERVQRLTDQKLLEKYGITARGLANPEIMKKYKETLLDRYGVSNPQVLESVAEKSGQTWSERYGPGNPEGYEVWLEAYKMTNNQNLDCDFPAQNEEVRKKMVETKRVRGSFNTSSHEERFHERLLGFFSEADILREYKSDDYPFHVDFYIKSRDLYIELNILWTHGGRWYDEESGQTTLRSWKRKASNSPYYQKAIEVWTLRDVEKRQWARDHDLNYVVFWDADCRDMGVWFASGCPSGKDWVKEYSWLGWI